MCMRACVYVCVCHRPRKNTEYSKIFFCYFSSKIHVSCGFSLKLLLLCYWNKYSQGACICLGKNNKTFPYILVSHTSLVIILSSSHVYNVCCMSNENQNKICLKQIHVIYFPKNCELL